MSGVGVLSVLHVAVGNLMKIVCPCRNLRLGKTVRDVENIDREPRFFIISDPHTLTL